MAKWHKQLFTGISVVYIVAVLFYAFFVVWRRLPLHPFAVDATIFSFSIMMFIVPAVGLLMTVSVYRKTAQDTLAPSRPNNLLIWVIFLVVCGLAFIGHFVIFMIQMVSLFTCNMAGDNTNQCNDLQYCCVYPNNALNSHCTNGPCVASPGVVIKQYPWELTPNDRFLWNIITIGVLMILEVIMLALSPYTASMTNEMIDWASPGDMMDYQTGVIASDESKKRR